MIKKNITLIVLSVITVGILFFIATDLLESSKDFNKAKQERENIFSKKNQVVTSFYPLYFFAQEIGKEKVDIHNIVPVEIEPTIYELTTQDITTIETSDLVIINGLDWEPWQNDIKNQKAIVIASSGLNENQVIENEHNKIIPYAWLSPIIAKQMVDNILAGFLQVDSVNAQYYKSNADKLKLELDKLDAEYRSGLANCQDKNIVTLDLAFSYLIKDYNLNQISIFGLINNVELTSQQITNITEFIKENNVKYIFTKGAVNFNWQTNIEKSLGIKILIFDTIEKLNKKEAIDGEDYFAKMRNNLMNLKTVLQCQ